MFSDGPHLATNAFELGDTSLGLETALGIEATYTYATGPLSIVINGFYTAYDDFIYEQATGEEEDDLPVFVFQAADAKLYGFEAQTKIHLGATKVGDFGKVDWDLDAQVDYVRAVLKNGNGDTDLPRIPPLSGLIGIEASMRLFDLRTELEYSAKQNKTASFELPTEDYLLWNTYLTLRPFDNQRLSVELRGTNLTNRDARQHTSFLKDLLPLPGRNFSVSLRAEF